MRRISTIVPTLFLTFFLSALLVIGGGVSTASALSLAEWACGGPGTVKHTTGGPFGGLGPTVCINGKTPDGRDGAELTAWFEKYTFGSTGAPVSTPGVVPSSGEIAGPLQSSGGR